MSLAPSTGNDEEAMILDVVRDLVSTRVAPRAAEIDDKAEFPWDIKELFAQNDLLGVPFPAEYGGVGSSFLTYVKVVEEVAKACASSALIIAVPGTRLAADPHRRQRGAKEALHSQARER